jgi:hypothetical protein
MKNAVVIYPTSFNELISVLRHQLELMYSTLINLSQDSNSFEQMKRTVIFFRLLKCKWNRL